MKALNIFKQLAGKWSLQRNIVNQAPDLSGTVQGLATFTADPNNSKQYLFAEKGEFLVNGASLQVSKNYIYELDEADDSIKIYDYKDNQKTNMLFSLVFSREAKHICAKTEHLCSKDLYKATFDIPEEEFNEFSLTYDVAGPHKKYVSSTTFKRLV